MSNIADQLLKYNSSHVWIMHLNVYFRFNSLPYYVGLQIIEKLEKQRRQPSPTECNTTCPQPVTWRHRSRDHSIPHLPFPIAMFYLQPFWDIWPQHANEHT